jgi:Spy/CpxP family protein refolding chaperone
LDHILWQKGRWIVRALVKGSVAMGLALLLTLPALAQQPERQGRGGRGGRGGGFGGGSLLQNPSVQKELKLTEDQIKKITEVVNEVRKKHQDEFTGLRDLDQAERREKMGTLMREVGEETRKALAKENVLTPDQEKRFKQIELQTEGPRAFVTANVQKSLKLTADQQDKIKTIVDDMTKEERAARESAGQGNFQGMFQKMQELRKDATAKITDVLTDDQKKEWKEMTGEPFQMQFGQGGGRRGGRGRQGPGGQ